MALDSIILKKLTEELKETIIDSRVERITMPAKDIVILKLRSRNGTWNLIISARSGMSRLHISQTEYENPLNPPSFCMLLRKYLGNARIKDINSVDSERIILIDFDVINEKGDRTSIQMSVEMMGRYSNIIIINSENMIIDAIKHIDPDTPDKRRIFPGVAFEMPPIQGKLPFLSTDTSSIISEITSYAKPLSSAILSSISGIGPVVTREIALQVTASDLEADLLEEDKKRILEEAIIRVKDAANDPNAPLYMVYENNLPIEYSFIPLIQYQPLQAVTFQSISQLLECYYSERERDTLLKTRSSGLKKQIDTLLERTIRRQRSRIEEMSSTEKADRAKLYGELLTVNQHQINKGMQAIKLMNYYDNSEIAIPLDIRLTPNQNAQRYYKEYRKLSTAHDILERLIREDSQEIKYLESVKYEAETATAEEEFLAIREELHQAGYLKSFKPKKKRIKTRSEEYFRYTSSDGFSILVGRNNTANDKLSLKTADKNDIWFHVKQGAGSHTVVLIDGREPTDLTLTEAAHIAAYHSSHSLDGQTAVDYTKIRYVKKASGQKTGMVIYTEYKTIYIVPDKDLIDSLRVKAKN